MGHVAHCIPSRSVPLRVWAEQQLSEHWYVYRPAALPEAGTDQARLYRREGRRRWLVDELVWRVRPFSDDCVLYATTRVGAGGAFLAVCGRREPVMVERGGRWIPKAVGLVRWSGFGVANGHAVREGVVVPIGAIRRAADRAGALQSGWFRTREAAPANAKQQAFEMAVEPAMTDEATGDPVLAAAVKDGAQSAAVALLMAGADANTTDIGGNTVLFLACREGEADLVRALLAKGANPKIRGVGGWSVLEVAVKTQHEDVVKVLLAGVQFTREDVEAVLTDPTVREWPSVVQLLDDYLQKGH